MKTLQKYKAIIVNGKMEKEVPVKEAADRLSEPVEVFQRFMDSIAIKMFDEHNIRIAQLDDLDRAERKKVNLDIIFWKEVDHNPFDKESKAEAPKKRRKRAPKVDQETEGKDKE